MYLQSFSITTLFAIITAAVASVIIGMFWYHPRVFGSMWMQLSGLSPEMNERARRGSTLYLIGGLMASMVAAYVLYWFGAFLSVYDWITAFELSFWCWLGFTAPTMLNSVFWEQRPLGIYLINASYWLVSLTVMALILLI